MDYPGSLIFPELGAFPSEQALSDHVLGVLSEWFSIETEVEGRYRGQDPVRIDAVLRPLDPTPWADSNPAFGVEFKIPKLNAGFRDYFQWAAQAVDYTHTDWNGYGRLQVFVCPSPITAVISTPNQLEAARQRRRKWESLEQARHWARRETNRAVEQGDDPWTDEELEHLAREKQRETIKHGEARDAEAVYEGFADDLDRHAAQGAITARGLTCLLGQLGVGDLMPTRYHGWSLIRSQNPLWCQEHGVHGGKQSLRPTLGAR